MDPLPPLPAPPPADDEAGPALPPEPGKLPAPEQHPEPVNEPAPADASDQSKGPRSSGWPVAIAVLAMIGVAVGVFVLLTWVFGGPVTCGEGDFSSDRFGYCIRVPSGWEVVAAADENEPTTRDTDRFQQPGAAGTILITAVPLAPGQDLDSFVSAVRSLDEEAGWDVGDISTTEVAGQDAMTFDVSAGEGGATRSREVVFVSDRFAWRVQVADDETNFEASTRALDELLTSWVFL